MRKILSLLLAASLGVSHAADTLPDLGDASQAVVTSQQMRQLGEQIMLQIRESPQYLDDPEITDYINALGFRLVAVSPDAQQDFEFFVVNDRTVNAFALPGGFVGVHTGLILTSTSESELAAVLGHEIAHVTQRHIARLFAQQQRAGYVSLAAIALAILAARSSPDLAQAAVAGAQYASLQTALNFTRDNESDADRVGLQILERSGFDPHAMPVFLERLQRTYRIYETNAPSYARTHPLTHERIADVQNRTDAMPFRQVPDSLAFQLVRARLQSQERDARDAVAYFDDILAQRKSVSEVPPRYGLVNALLRGKQVARAATEMARLQAMAPDEPMVWTLAARVRLAAGRPADVLPFYREALAKFPGRRALVYDYARALLDARQPADSLTLVSDALRQRRQDGHLYELQAESYAGLGQHLQQHRALAEAYVLAGSIPAAVEQLQLALRARDGDFYQLSSAEARLKELRRVEEESRKRH